MRKCIGWCELYLVNTETFCSRLCSNTSKSVLWPTAYSSHIFSTLLDLIPYPGGSEKFVTALQLPSCQCPDFTGMLSHRHDTLAMYVCGLKFVTHISA